MERIDAETARKLYPNVKGPIFGADLWSGFAILDMGKGAHGVMVAGKFAACCPDYTSAKIFGRTEADLRAAPRMPKTVVAFALKHSIPIGCQYASDGKSISYYYIVDNKGNQVDMTRSGTTVRHALAMCRRYLANKTRV